VCDLELRHPRRQLNLGSPQRSNEHKPLLGSGAAPASSEAEQSSPDNFRASLFQHLSMERLRPGFFLLWPAAGQAPAFTIVTDQNEAAVSGQTDRGRSVRRSLRSLGCRMPSHNPVAAIDTSRELFPVTRRNNFSRIHRMGIHFTQLKAGKCVCGFACQLLLLRRFRQAKPPVPHLDHQYVARCT
jgi:hypothetical protein